MNEHVYAVIMAGGSGTRFWPLSRRARPKQLLHLGGAPESLLQATVRRLERLEIPPARVLVVTSALIAPAVREDLPTVPRENVLAEPAARNTAPCVGWAAHVAVARDPDAVLAVLASDHHIADEAAYAAVAQRAIDVAADGTLVTVGLKPTRPETGYGYLQLGEALGASARRVLRFVEKPELARATDMVAAGDYLWNSGQFFFRADVILRELGTHVPELSRGLAELASDPSSLARIYGTLPRVSIDVAVMEKAARIAVVPGDFGWSDVGSFATAWELATKDAGGNAAPPDAVLVDTENCLVRAPAGKVVALIGVSDLVIIDTGDALLVMPRDRAQDVKKVVDALTARDSGSLT